MRAFLAVVDLEPATRGERARQAVTGLGFVLVAEGALRARYRDRDRSLAREARVRAGASRDLSSAARWAVDARNRARDETRRWDLDALRLLAEDRNRRLYGHALGPTYEELRTGRTPHGRRPPRTDAEIISAAGRSNASVDRAGEALALAGAALLLGVFAWGARGAVRVGRQSLARAVWWTSVELFAACVGGWLGARALGLAGLTAGLLVGAVGALWGAALGGAVGLVLGATLAGRAVRWWRARPR